MTYVGGLLASMLVVWLLSLTYFDADERNLLRAPFWVRSLFWFLPSTDADWE